MAKNVSTKAGVIPKKTTVNWPGNNKSLIINTTISMRDGSAMTTRETYSMDGDALVLDSHASSSYGELEEHMVYEKQ